MKRLTLIKNSLLILYSSVIHFILIILFILPSPFNLLGNGFEFGPDVRVDLPEEVRDSYVYRGGICARGDTIYICGMASFFDAYSEHVFLAKSTDSGLSFNEIKMVNELVHVYEPQFALGLSGTLYFTYVIYYLDSNVEYIYFTKSTDHGESFSSEIKVNDSINVWCSMPTISLDQGENIYIAWGERRSQDSKYQIYFSKSVDGGATFIPSLKVSKHDGYTEHRPNIAFDKNNGNLYLSWIRSDSIIFIRSTNMGESFENEICAMSGIDLRDFNMMDVSENGDIGIVSAKSGKIYFNISSDNGQHFSSPIKVYENAPDSSYQRNPKLYMQENNIYVIWYDLRQIEEYLWESRIYFSISTNRGKSFEPPISVADSTAEDVFMVTGGVTSSENGFVYVIWNDCRTDPFFCERHHTYCSRAVIPVGINQENIFQNYPEDYLLSQNYPNPFNESTIINYKLRIMNFVEIAIYNLLGQKIETLVSERQPAGFHQVEFKGENLSSGVYLYRMEVTDPLRSTGVWSEVKKMVLLR